MASVRLRPVNQQPTSPSSTTLSQSSSPRELADQSPGPSVMFAPPTTPSGGHRRPLSPGTLRGIQYQGSGAHHRPDHRIPRLDLDLSSNASLALRGYPPPPTGTYNFRIFILRSIVSDPIRRP
ncbi:hypothetical protein PUNSTDRAFT_55101 [Punctularia strigosozonata HHB-11173 SS5]|uniref:Uncharacterized protein n=1 Tax=Punctularia strigosozonata (strain HHB-11173) TaxID=741275 RepID=R7S4M2_PUNST|nr:uncharacterized protein PUNSTDRAFT_55101 [Punctularia strigosozonata HHB-11173 SS5]EIN05183.1 hypothetical protein PUNSTDRAFT_55101 [Punctularia strigosozonata HHB-11173 SS5]